MPSFRKLSRAEVAPIEQPARSARAQRRYEYDAYLADFAPGDYGRVELATDERRALVRTRLQSAAERRGLVLHFRPGPNPVLIFRVETAPLPALRSDPTSTAAADQRPDSPSRPTVRPPGLPGSRQTPAERYHTMLPRWMREKQRSGPQAGSKRRTR